MKYIDAEKLKTKIEKRKNILDVESPFGVGGRVELELVLDAITSLQQEAQEEEKVRKERYDESFMSYWKSVIDTIDNKRVLPSFKGQLLHDFKNELHTMKQIVGLINHPEIHEGLFDRLALVFAAWGGYHFHPKESLPEDALQQEQPEADLEKEIEMYISSKGLLDYAFLVPSIARHFYGLRNRALEEAARHVYESWNGGTMDDVRRDMAELGKVLNARKE